MRAGLLEQNTVDVLHGSASVSGWTREGLPHDGIHMRFRRAHPSTVPS